MTFAKLSNGIELEIQTSRTDSFDEIYKTLALMERFPNLGSAVYGIEDPSVRQLPVSRFPYHVIFRRQEYRISVVAIAHERKRPGYWNE